MLNYFYFQRCNVVQAQYYCEDDATAIDEVEEAVVFDGGDKFLNDATAMTVRVKPVIFDHSTSRT